MALTPNDIDVLIHFCVCSGRHEWQDTPAVKESIQKFLNDGLLGFSSNPSGYEITKKGKAHLEQLCNLPYPVQAWVDASGNLISKG